MKISKKNLQLLIKKHLNIVKEDYKGIIGGNRSGEGKPTVFDTEEQNLLARNANDPEVAKQLDNDTDLKKRIGPSPKANPKKQKSVAARMFSGKSFKKNALWMWGKKAFPGSNVFLIPIAGGSKEVAKLIFDYESDFKAKDVRWSKTSPESRAYFSDEYKKERNEMSQQDLAIYKKSVVDFETRRHLLLDMSDEGINIMKNLGVNISEASSIDFEKDIMFIPLATGTSRNFISSPHMIIHALCDTTGEKGGTEIDLIINPLQASMVTLISDMGVSPYTLKLLDQNLKSNMHNILRTVGTTYAFRKGLVLTGQDMVAEMLTQEITQQRPKGLNTTIPNVAGASFNPTSFNLLSEAHQLAFMDFRESVVLASKQIKELLKGKVVVINVV
tara:strand:+ start:2029 stop:3189 length:1161 start_codon:yes stop_codon:yes gene_type:complete